MNTDKKDCYLIAGLGNPGSKYDRTRHNTGFQALDFFLNHAVSNIENSVSQKFTTDQKHKSLIVKACVSGHELILAKPQTHMNHSGEAIQSLAFYNNIPLENILIIHDDIDLPFGAIRLSHDAGPAGHNGVSSIIERLGSKEFTRLRVGIGQAEKRGNRDSKSFVLSTFTKEEEEKLLSRIIPAVTQSVSTFLDKGYEEAAAIHNKKLLKKSLS